jgi:hypothetical protein
VLDTGSLAVVGTGYRLGDISLEAKACVEQADTVFYLVEDSITATWIRRLNSNAINLHGLYGVGKERRETYEEMTSAVVDTVRSGAFVCAAVYGHPGVFAHPMHEAVRRLREQGFRARMLPAPSAEDWLFADLGLDPARDGCSSFEATDLLINRRIYDPTSLLVIWQIGVIGSIDYQEEYPYRKNLGLLVEALLVNYTPEHRVATYEISPFAICEPCVRWMELSELSAADVTPSSTLVVPPRGRRVSSQETMEKLGMPASSHSYRVVAKDLIREPVGDEIPWP